MMAKPRPAGPARAASIAALMGNGLDLLTDTRHTMQARRQGLCFFLVSMTVRGLVDIAQAFDDCNDRGDHFIGNLRQQFCRRWHADRWRVAHKG